jgi:hypothetical protein
MKGGETMDNTDKARENYCRRVAKQQGLYLKKSRAKTWTINNRQGYMILGISTNIIQAGQYFDLSLDDVATYLKAE